MRTQQACEIKFRHDLLWRKGLIVLVIIFFSVTLDSFFYSIQNEDAITEEFHTTDRIQKQHVVSMFPIKRSNNTTYIKTSNYAFQPRNKPFPCIDIDETNITNRTKGFYYIKVHKTASSTLAGIALQIAQRHKNASHPCHVHAHHEKARNLNLTHRDPDNSFVWTMIRNPKHRTLSSYFYFNVTLNNENPTGPSMMRWLKIHRNSQFHYLQTQPNDRYDTHDPNESAKSVLRDYNFIGLVERLDESLVVLRLLFGLDAKDILYVRSKRSGGYVSDTRDNTTCKYIIPKFTTPEVDEYLQSDQWYNDNRLDYALYEQVEKSLNATIEMIGRDKFERAYEEHREWMKIVNEKCAPFTKFPCSEEGIRQMDTKCSWHDIGCANDCINSL